MFLSLLYFTVHVLLHYFDRRSTEVNEVKFPHCSEEAFEVGEKMKVFCSSLSSDLHFRFILDSLLLLLWLRDAAGCDVNPLFTSKASVNRLSPQKWDQSRLRRAIYEPRVTFFQIAVTVCVRFLGQVCWRRSLRFCS